MHNEIGVDNVLTEVDRYIMAAFARRVSPHIVTAHHTIYQLDPILAALFGTTAIVSLERKPDSELDRVAAPLRKARPPLSYCVASYWSPINEERHSVCHVAHNHYARPRQLAAAVLFFSLSHQAGYSGTYRPNVAYTATHFLSRFAKHKHSWPVHFDGDTAGANDSVWKIPTEARERWLKLIGWDRLIARLEEEFTRDPIAGKRFTRAAIGHYGERDKSRAEKDGREAVELWFEASRRYPELDRELGAPCIAGLRNMWQQQRLTLSQAAFMTASYLLWHEAAPDTEWGYTFPCNVATTCCVLTSGVVKPLEREQTALMAWLSKTLFVHPLIRDYATKVTNDYLLQQSEIWRRVVGHNIPNLLIRPAMLLSDEMINLFDDARNSPRDLDGCLERGELKAKALSGLLKHYRAFLGFLASPKTTEKILLQGAQRFTLPQLQQELDDLFEGIIKRTLRLLPQNRERLWLYFDETFRDDAPQLGNVAMTREILINLITNAARHYTDEGIKNDPNCTRIHIGLKRDPSAWIFTVTDGAGGFEDLAGIRKKLQIIQQEKKNLNKVMSTMIDKSIYDHTGDEYSNGIGLISCAYYLRQLKFNEIGREGRIDLSNTDTGACVTLTIPVH